MFAVNYSNARENLKTYCNKVNDDKVKSTEFLYDLLYSRQLK